MIWHKKVKGRMLGGCENGNQVMVGWIISYHIISEYLLGRPSSVAQGRHSLSTKLLQYGTVHPGSRYRPTQSQENYSRKFVIVSAAAAAVPLRAMSANLLHWKRTWHV